MSKRWRIRPFDRQQIDAFARSAALSPVLAQLLLARGIHEVDQAHQFLEPKLSDLRDPNELPGVAAAADLLYVAIGDKRRIVIYGDYDVDGMSGTAILHQCLRLLGGNVGYFVPNRLDDGYGLGEDALRKLAADGAQVLVTVDCGITSVEEARVARELGVKLIVTDHHHPRATLPDADVLVHPSLPGSTYPFAGLCGAGVAFKLAWALCQRASGAARVAPAMRDFLLQAVALAALGTVADVVPLLDENRPLVRHGLMSLKERPTLGLQELMRVSGLDKKRELESEDFGFGLAPRLNAAGRFGQALLGVELLITDNPSRAADLADYVNELNSSRQSLERKIYLAANKQLQADFDPHNDAALVLGGRGWHPGVIGIVAGRLAERYHRPTVLVAWDEVGAKPGVGSARSIPGFNLFEALDACSHHLLKHGGHAAAAGLSIEEDKLDAFRSEFCEHAAGEITEAERVAELFIDGEFPISAFTLKVVEQMERLAPFGAGNHRPIWCTTEVSLARPPKVIGSGGRHLSLEIAQHELKMRAVAFGGGEWAEELNAVEGPLQIAFKPVINTFRGRRRVELQIIDWRPARSLAAAN